MNPELWQQVRGILEQAVDLAPDEREAYLDHACHSDSELRREVESLIGSHERAGTKFMQAPAVDLLGSIAVDGLPITRIGRRVGVYELVEEIGHGGMGEVYRATRADG